MAIAPALGPHPPRRRRAAHTALLINPFYAKDPRASFGKHVLTPTLALTSIAGATPPHWDVRYWDENLLQGPPPADPLPHVVGITVHLTFARRAYELAAWYRAQGSIVVLGGLHVLSCPGRGARACRCDRDRRRRAAVAADSRRHRARARCSDATQPTTRGRIRWIRRARRAILPARVVPHDDERDRDARLSQSLRLLLSVDRRPAHAVSDARGRSRSSMRSRPTDSRTSCSSTTISARDRTICASSARRCEPLGDHLERRGHHRRDRRPDARARDGAGRLHRRVRRLRIAERGQSDATRASARPRRSTTRAASRCSIVTESR